MNLNEADTTELKKIPGIGSAIARMIVNYRTPVSYTHIDVYKRQGLFKIEF